MSRRDATRSKIVETAAALLREQGPAALTTRGVAEAAGLQAPAIYRLFGDKDGLLDAVAEHVMATHVSAKAQSAQEAAARAADPLEDLRAGWQTQIEFGLANPTLFRLLSDPDRALPSPAAQAGRRVLEARVHRIAAAGRLRVGERRAADLLHAAGTGTIQLLLSLPQGQRDAGLADAMYEAVLRQVLTDAHPQPDAGPTAATVAFLAVVPQVPGLSAAERALLTEWLDRAIDGARVSSPT